MPDAATLGARPLGAMPGVWPNTHFGVLHEHFKPFGYICHHCPAVL